MTIEEFIKKRKEELVSNEAIIKKIKKNHKIIYDLNFMLHVNKFKLSIHKFGKRYSEFVKSIQKFLEGDYGHISRPENQITKQSKFGIIIGMYTCWDACVEIDQYLWMEDDRQHSCIVVKCLDWKNE